MSKIEFMLTLITYPETRHARPMHRCFESAHEPDEGCPINGGMTENALMLFEHEDAFAGLGKMMH